jgi:hypothetical protein
MVKTWEERGIEDGRGREREKEHKQKENNYMNL